MKSIFFKVMLVTNLFLICNCKAQIVNNYINFYNHTISNLNPIISTKSQYYNLPFSNFYNELQNRNINIQGWFYDTKISPSTKYYVLKLFLSDLNMLNIASENSYHDPRISITFKDEIPNQVQTLMERNHSQWNPVVAQFFSDIKVESIRFIGVRGYDSTDYSAK
ncbi:hypothetical protein ODZ84_03210 [Chryseobacterium fluminis]|uniref:hypothetical protein n=1 Tax=Chryseobacterium fluminis TaxID=2983606 RepID=UPI0022533382|nr:hypothetical protein [Chryseobacterium sp. MMS21-Ot14]UZT98596.1 hypothetical protein ODZ84_03210 [Chryseobacterium sp. MMS21-Ot14]